MSFKQLMNHSPFSDELLAILIPTIGTPIEHTLHMNPEVIHLLQWAQDKGVMVIGNCTGNFFLAEAGLLDGKRATTHWGYQDLFKQKYPSVNLQADKLITVDGNIYCAGGGLAWFDLGIHIIEKQLGYDAAVQTAKAFVIDYRRESQLSYNLSRTSIQHQDDMIAQVQSYLDEYYSRQQNLDELAALFNVSKRTLIRRFKQALNSTPNAYIQTIRIEVAQKLLAESPLSVEQIMNNVGYEDISSFRRLFKHQVGLTPVEYRKRFAKHY
jgi:transcriptional regulator GlxA family with amidase domain